MDKTFDLSEKEAKDPNFSFLQAGSYRTPAAVKVSQVPDNPTDGPVSLQYVSKEGVCWKGGLDVPPRIMDQIAANWLVSRRFGVLTPEPAPGTRGCALFLWEVSGAGGAFTNFHAVSPARRQQLMQLLEAPEPD